MKLGLVSLVAIVLAAGACAYGTDSSSHADDRTPASRSGAAGASDNAGDDAGAGATYESGAPDAGARDTADPFADLDSGDAATPPVVDSGLATKDGPDPGCASTGTQSACASCCATENPAATATLNSAIMACACGASGACSTECATEVCVDVAATPGSACYTCLSSALGSGGICYTPVQTACLAESSCTAYLSCESSECSGLP